ncbi:MAG: PEP-CTERM sorting domain-containing protein [Myxococcota bacterium]
MTGVVDQSVFALWTPSVPIPEPGTAVLMGLGLLGLSARKRREG